MEGLVSHCSWRWFISQNMIGNTCLWRSLQGLIPLRLGPLEFTPLASEMAQWVTAPGYVSLTTWVQSWNPQFQRGTKRASSSQLSSDLYLCSTAWTYMRSRSHITHSIHTQWWQNKWMNESVNWSSSGLHRWAPLQLEWVRWWREMGEKKKASKTDRFKTWEDESGECDR